MQSLVPDSDGVGYWLVASDGGIFAFNAPIQGLDGRPQAAKPVTGMVPYGDGYMMVGEDGGIFNFSDKALRRLARWLAAGPPDRLRLRPP